MITDAMLDALLGEDAPFGDLTTQALGIAGRPGRMRFAARAAMTLCCVEEGERLLGRLGLRVESLRASGDDAAAGEVFLEAEGPAAALLLGWKTVQTLVEHTSGVAGAARRIVVAARAVAPDVVVACTRKALPGSRALMSRAVLAGGAQMHRLGLSETVLVFPEHRAFLGGLDGFLAELAGLKRRLPEKKVVVETASADEAVVLARHGADVIQLEKLPPDRVRRVVEQVQGFSPAPVIAAAGGVNEANAADYAATGCRLLVTSAPYWARPADVKVTVEGIGPDRWT